MAKLLSLLVDLDGANNPVEVEVGGCETPQDALAGEWLRRFGSEGSPKPFVNWDWKDPSHYWVDWVDFDESAHRLDAIVL